MYSYRNICQHFFAFLRKKNKKNYSKDQCLGKIFHVDPTDICCEKAENMCLMVKNVKSSVMLEAAWILYQRMIDDDKKKSD